MATKKLVAISVFICLDRVLYCTFNSIRLILRICHTKRMNAKRMDALSAIGIEIHTP